MADESRYLTTKESYALLKISRSQFYDQYYEQLANDPTTLKLGSRLRYFRPTLEALLKPLDHDEVKSRSKNMKNLLGNLVSNPRPRPTLPGWNE
jgi:predicted DNA-binding transcriptional regulator AlpA